MRFSVYAMLQLVVQLGFCVSFFFVGYGSFFVDRQAASLGIWMNMYASLALCLSAPLCVFSLRLTAPHSHSLVKILSF